MFVQATENLPAAIGATVSVWLNAWAASGIRSAINRARHTGKSVMRIKVESTMVDSEKTRRILRRYRVIAVVGLSAQWHRPSYFAAKYLQEHGYRVIPVNPTYDTILGEKCYKRLSDIPEKVEVVDCFRKSSEIPAIADEAIAIGAKVLWMQLGVENAEARAKAEAAGLEVIENRCMKIEHGRFFGGLGWAGVNTKVISARRSS